MKQVIHADKQVVCREIEIIIMICIIMYSE